LITLLDVIFACAALALLAAVVVLLVEVVLALTTRSRRSLVRGRRPPIAVLIPAHNEESVISGAIRSILPQLSDTDQLVVVADNCSDKTGEIASDEGARVVVRLDPARVGKGYALDFGVRNLRPSRPEVVIVIDADCQVAPGAIDTLARACASSSRPVQALYLMHVVPNSHPGTRLAQFAWVIKNHVRPLGLLRLDLPCQLMGTGMAFPWAVLANAELATGDIVEDLKLGISCARAGAPPLFCPDALVTGTFPTSREGMRVQRTRWEHGHLGMMLKEAPRLLFESFTNANPRLMALALDLSIPPLALLALLLGAVWLASLLLYVTTELGLPLALSTAAVLMLMITVFLSWLRYGRQTLSLGDLAYATVYSTAKIPLYVKFLFSRQTAWVRSKRDGDGSR
jgi:cellulose synthase/poly-beta-1,6-N-acetylglucosamine synthase-like glycosyltransferase